MAAPLRALLRHLRRTGFVVFNLIVIGLIVAWGAATSNRGEDGIANIPTLLIGPVGTMFLLALLIAGWIAWGVFVTLRWRRHRDAPR